MELTVYSIPATGIFALLAALAIVALVYPDAAVRDRALLIIRAVFGRRE
ncbi:hypothetical protein [Streptomyces sp. SID14515]|nr:hypothetical protein [Streptomyces sp. SID14515]NEB36760.1 hypothetical protein [Streptomyces sp. SID14515]